MLEPPLAWDPSRANLTECIEVFDGGFELLQQFSDGGYRVRNRLTPAFCHSERSEESRDPQAPFLVGARFLTAFGMTEGSMIATTVETTAPAVTEWLRVVAVGCCADAVGP